jgi:hypothetical protein
LSHVLQPKLLIALTCLHDVSKALGAIPFVWGPRLAPKGVDDRKQLWPLEM